MMKIYLFAILPSLAAWASPTVPFDEVTLLKDLVAVSSGTASIAGVNQVQEKTGALLGALGFSVEYISNPQDLSGTPKSGKQVVAVLKGSDPVLNKKFITLIAHADTVFEKLNPYVVSADGKTAKGSGVSDDKGGIVVGISALTSLLKEGAPRFSIRFIVSPSEETGSAGFESRLADFAKDSALVLGLEPARENGSVVKSRKGIRWYEIKVTGKEAHAGVNHDQGVNACQELSIKLDQLQRLTDYKKGTTVSIGHMEGGKDKFNIVCGTASAKIDVRFSNPKLADGLFRKIETILNQNHVESYKDHEKSKTTLEISVNDAPFVMTGDAGRLLKKYLELLKQVEGKNFQGEDTGGAADVNMMSASNVPILDGLGPIGGGYHTADEFILLASLKTRADTLSQFLKFSDQNLR